LAGFRLMLGEIGNSLSVFWEALCKL
jgi:hypothetical protein